MSSSNSAAEAALASSKVGGAAVLPKLKKLDNFRAKLSFRQFLDPLSPWRRPDWPPVVVPAVEPAVAAPPASVSLGGGAVVVVVPVGGVGGAADLALSVLRDGRVQVPENSKTCIPCFFSLWHFFLLLLS